MSPVAFFLMSGVLWGGLGLGSLARHLRPEIARWTGPLLKFQALTFVLVALFVSAWGLNISAADLTLLSLPLIGAAIATVSLVAGGRLAAWLGMPPAQRGAFMAAAAISNIGVTFGIPLCYAFFGLEGQALAGLFMLYFPLFVFLVLFSLSERMSRSAAGESLEGDTLLGLLLAFLRDPFRIAPLGAYALGFIFNLALGHDAIPAWLKRVNEVCLFGSMVSAFLAIGFTIHPGGLRANASPIAWLCALKFVLAPVLGLSLAWLIGLSETGLYVVSIQAACPVGIFSVLTASIYGFDEELAGSALLITTAIANLAALAAFFYWIPDL